MEETRSRSYEGRFCAEMEEVVLQAGGGCRRLGLQGRGRGESHPQLHQLVAFHAGHARFFKESSEEERESTPRSPCCTRVGWHFVKEWNADSKDGPINWLMIATPFGRWLAYVQGAAIALAQKLMTVVDEQSKPLYSSKLSSVDDACGTSSSGLASEKSSIDEHSLGS